MGPHQVFGHEGLVLSMPVLRAVDFAYDVQRRVVGLKSHRETEACPSPRDSWPLRHATALLMLILVSIALVTSARNRMRNFFGRCCRWPRREARMLDEDNEFRLLDAEEAREARLAILGSGRQASPSQDQ